MKQGDKVHYISRHLVTPENGIIKSICDDPEYAFVVYNCAGDWDNYADYTGAKTRISALKEGWYEEPTTMVDEEDDDSLIDTAIDLGVAAATAIGIFSGDDTPDTPSDDSVEMGGGSFGGAGASGEW